MAYEILIGGYTVLPNSLVIFDDQKVEIMSSADAVDAHADTNLGAQILYTIPLSRICEEAGQDPHALDILIALDQITSKGNGAIHGCLNALLSKMLLLSQKI